MKIDDLSDRDRRLVREQLLDAQSRWLDESVAEESTPTLRTLALVMADAFRQEAELYKSRVTAISTTNFFMDEETRDHSDSGAAAAQAHGSGTSADLP